MSDKLRIVFMGTPEFAVRTLDRIVESGHEVCAVVTSPDRPAGRGQKIRQSAVKTYALGKELALLQPESLKNNDFIKKLEDIDADVFVVVAFRMLPVVVWKMPHKGTVNLHASLLPQYRGAAPINWAIINGEKKTGVSTFFINEVIDTGDIIMKKEQVITDKMNAGELHDQLMNAGAELMVQTLSSICAGIVVGNTQKDIDSTELKNAPKIYKADCKINFDTPSIQVYNKIRGLAPYPGAWCAMKIRSKNKLVSFKLFSSRQTDIIVEKDYNNILPGDNGILIPCSDTYILVSDFQMEGKRRMKYSEFIAGNSIEDLELIH